MNAEEKLARLARWVAGAVSGLTALALPASYLALSYQHHVASLETEAAMQARTVTEVVNRNPELWRYQIHTLEQILQRRIPGAPLESRSIVDAAGELVAEAPAALRSPVMKRSEAILDAGEPVGRLEITRSLRPVLLGTAGAGALGLLLGGGAFFALRVFPSRVLGRVLRVLFAEKERAHVTLRSIADGVIATDGEDRVVLLNAAAEALTGWPEEQALGRTLAEVYRVAPHDPEPLGPRRPAAPVRLHARGGGEYLVAESRAPIGDEGGLPVGQVVVFRDVTERSRLEEELVRAQKLESVGLLAVGIAHDLNNALTAILGNLAMAALRAGPTGGVTERLVAADKAVQRAASLTRQLLTFSQGGAPLKQTVSLPEFLQDAVSFALTGSRVRCRFSAPPDLWPVDVDEGQIGQVINSLVLNADQAMPSGGTLAVSAYNLVVSGRDPLPLSRGRYVKLSFTDQGVGIPAENLKRIFEPFFTTKREGTGLGLASVYSIVHRHGGHIDVQSEPGEGTTFDLYLPASDRPFAPPPRTERLPPRGTGRILVMDDDAPIRDVALGLLHELGYEGEAVGDGDRTVARYREARDAGTPFDAVITDLPAAHDVSADEVLECLREIDPAVKVVVTSGYHTAPGLASLLERGYAGALTKPFGLREVASVLRRVFSSEG